MISLEEVRQSIISTFKGIHDAGYSSTLVNYPNYVVVDLEHQRDPFVSVELETAKIDKGGVGEREIFVRGILRVYYYYRDGTGVANAYTYTDYLNNYLSMTLVGAIQYEAIDVLNVVSFPGWKGCMNSVPFSVVKGLNC